MIHSKTRTTANVERVDKSAGTSHSSELGQADDDVLKFVICMSGLKQGPR